ncbi:MAG: hypothetical protein GY790_19410 [Bacteroidetes bacterium]|nr:hypothetical protein [Bacteroidota bacterium]
MALLLVITGAKEKEQQLSKLESGFLNPPPDARPHTFWIWMNGNVTREGITADLEAMARVGIGGVLLFNVAGSHGTDIPAGPVDYLSDEWLNLVKYTAGEADRLGIEMGLHNCAGWATTGGPWIKPEDGMQQLVSAEISLWGNRHVVQKLPHPEVFEGYYRDIAVYAIPRNMDRGYRVHQWEPKTGQRGGRAGRQPDLSPVPEGSAIALESIIEISRYVNEEGILEWDAPPGSWTILRLGYTPKGNTNQPAAESGRGLEIDKLRRETLDLHWREGIQPVLDHLGPLVGNSFHIIHLDSYEAGLHHWTPRMRQEFKKLRGYDPTPYLLALTGRLIEDPATTERFLWDFRRTISDLFTENYYGYYADLCHENGLHFLNEPYTSCFEGLQVAAKVDFPTAEFWADGGYSFSLRLAASLAHIHGRRYAGAEAFTGAPHLARWENHPGSLKEVGDWAWTQGINRLILHSYPHQPWTDVAPGMTMGQYGCHFDRNNTWWEPGRAWVQYLHRSQYLLQEGENVADVLCYAGDAAPIGGVNRPDIKDSGYDYDACGTDILAELKVEQGDVVLPSGKRYRLLVLQDTEFMRPHFAQKIKELVLEGASVLGPKPKYTPSLEGFPASEKEVMAIGEEVWGSCDGLKVQSNRYGMGQVFSGISPTEALKIMQLAPQVIIPDESPEIAWIQRTTGDADVYFLSNQSGRVIHTLAGFRSRGKKPEFWDAVNGTIRPAQGWTLEGEHTKVPLNLMPGESVFVVFRHRGKPGRDPYVSVDNPSVEEKDSLWFAGIEAGKGVQVRTWENGKHILQRASGKAKEINIHGLPAPLELEGPWRVQFQEGRGAPEEVALDDLVSWHKHPDPGIQYFSGTAKYSLQFEVPESYIKEDQEIWLDLGQVEVIAELRLNGKETGILWHKPFRVEVSDDIRSGSNNIEIQVTNLWVNRLIGDEQYPDDCEWGEGKYLSHWPKWFMDDEERPEPARITFTTWKHWAKDDNLLPSGLMGPVTLRCSKLNPAL